MRLTGDGQQLREDLRLFSTGKAVMWIDATVAGGILENPLQPKVVSNPSSDNEVIIAQEHPLQPPTSNFPSVP